MNHKVAVIGGGPGGYVTAIRLKQKGIDVVLFEKERLGGECLNQGCIPTKALVKVADLYNEMKNSSIFGINVEALSYDYEKVYERKNAVIERLVSGLDYIYKKREIPIINEEVTAVSKPGDKFSVKTKSNEYTAEYVVVATGSAPFELPQMKFDGVDFLSSSDVLALKSLPEHITIIGGGTIGCEFASIFNNFGVKVEIVELIPNLLNNEDQEIVKKLNIAFKKKKIKIHLGTKVEEYSKEGDKITLKLANGKEIVTNKVLISTGRVPVCSVKFEDLEVEYDRNRIAIDSKMETNVANLFAIGDITGKMMLAHTASKQGLMVAETIEGRINGNENKQPNELIYCNIPRCTFTEPEVASVGYTEETAKEAGFDIKIGRFNYMANGKAIGMNATDGMAKVIVDAKTEKVIGVHIVGSTATELIAAGSVMVNLGLTVDMLDKVIYAHPTLSEVIMEATEDINNLSTHKI
ncbi:MAG: dihydrolipoyl dehydrogenase [Candidatus Cloacimonadia bacterium]